MAFWNRRKKRQQEQEAFERDSRQEEGTGAVASENEDATGNDADTGMYQTEQINPSGRNDQKRYVTECCQGIQEADRQIEGIRKEYQEVTDSLLDIQKIDRAEGEEKKNLLNAANNIVKLTKERNRYKNRNLTISDVVIRRFEPYENNLVDEIKKMYGAEAYQKAIEGDIDKLHEEKKKLRGEKQEIIEKQNSLKNMAKVLIVLILSLFALFVTIYYALETDMTLPYLGTIFLAAVSSTVIFMESNRNRRDMMLADRKMDKAVSLLNRVKIKCVNNRNLLDYSREKFGVASAAEFEHLWNEYVRAKEYERKFRENTEQLNYYCSHLSELLMRMQVMDCEIWIGQALAIADSREMVEIRHKLNTQRQILRERVAYNEKVKNDYLQNINTVMKENPENKEELLKIVEGYIGEKEGEADTDNRE